MTSTTTEGTTVAVRETPLEAGACDRCGFRAYVRIALSTKPGAPQRTLDFCAHHYNENEAALVARGVEIVGDIREQLSPRKITAPEWR